MGALTKKERDGLEEVFLSIHKHRKTYYFFNKYPFKGKKNTLKKFNIANLLLFFNKKKKALRK